MKSFFEKQGEKVGAILNLIAYTLTFLVQVFQ